MNTLEFPALLQTFFTDRLIRVAIQITKSNDRAKWAAVPYNQSYLKSWVGVRHGNFLRGLQIRMLMFCGYSAITQPAREK